LRLLLDEMYTPTVAAELRTGGHDVVSVHDLGSALPTGASDVDVLEAAQREGRVLVTENVRDYRPLEGALLADRSHHVGMVYTSNRQFPRGDPATVGRLVHALDALLRDAPDLRDRSIFLARVDRRPA
jgi:predicted nuclease of predicted toxin-antitoxin system